MSRVMYLFIMIILLMSAGCQSSVATPTLTVVLPSRTPRPLNTLPPTQTPRVIGTLTPTPTVTPSPAAPATGTPPPLIFTPRPVSPVPEGALIPRGDEGVTIGMSAGGRPILARTFGNGPQAVLLVGGIHGGWESNTVTLMRELIDHFEANPDDVLPGVALVIIAAMNPDGVAVGPDLAGRFNGNGVDLNRNWACGWQPDAVWREGPVDPGAFPFSEPETQAVAAYIESLRPQVALFYHSAADGIFPGDCDRRQGEWRSGRVAAVYGEAASYSYGAAFSAYPVTGTAPSWADGLGIAAADVELSSARDSQFTRNLRGVMAVQCWLVGGAAGCDS